MGNTGSSIVVGRTQAIQRVECIIYDLLKEDGSGVDCDNIRKHKDVIEKIVGHVVVTKEELKLFSTRISKKMVLFPFIGEGSCGKSTLINALLGDRYLPFSCSKETATRIYIMAAAENLQEPPCLYKSLERSEETVVARGVAKIHEAIRKFNEDSQNNLEVPEILLIYTKIPFFESAQRDTSLNPIIMDCPGIEDVMKDMQQYLNVVSGVIYVHNYERFLQNHERIREDLQRMKQMKIIFVTSRFDAYYSVFTGDNPDKTKVKQKVTEAFRDLVKEENVIPVSGRWALCSKLYNDRQARHVVDQAMSDLKLNNHSNATECNHEEVMKFSNILELEKRLKNFLDEVDQNNWHSEVVTICDGFLKRFIQVGKRCEQDLLRKKDDQDKHVEIASRTIKGIRNVSWKSSETLEEEFKNHVKDGVFLKVVKEEMKNLTDEFFDTLREKKKFEQDLKNFKKNDVPKKKSEQVKTHVKAFIRSKYDEVRNIYEVFVENLEFRTPRLEIEIKDDFELVDNKSDNGWAPWIYGGALGGALGGVGAAVAGISAGPITLAAVSGGAIAVGAHILYKKFKKIDLDKEKETCLEEISGRKSEEELVKKAMEYSKKVVEELTSSASKFKEDCLKRCEENLSEVKNVSTGLDDKIAELNAALKIFHELQKDLSNMRVLPDDTIAQLPNIDMGLC